MKFGVFGTGMVGQTIGSKLVACGHEVKLGSRTATNEQGKAWAATAGTSKGSPSTLFVMTQTDDRATGTD